VAALVLAKRLNADHSDRPAATAPCSCGGVARYQGRREKLFLTALGELILNRAYFHCSTCHQGFFPRDLALDLEGTWLSPGVRRMVGMAGSAVSFEEGSTLLHELAGISCSAKLVERTAEGIGAAIAAQEQAHVKPDQTGQLPPTLYLGMDGTGVPMRGSEVAGRPGKQPDGSARTREVKLCTVWSAESRDKEGTPMRDRGSVTYSAAIESAAMVDTDNGLAEFAQRVQREAQRRRFDHAHRRVIIGDGAAWIWNLAEELFPGAIQIVDRFHVKEHLAETGRVIWGPGSALGKDWLRKRYAELDAGDIPLLVERLRVHADRYDEVRKCINYLINNQHRMRYAEFHAAGLCTSSGVVEAACKVVVGARLKRSGMHWTIYGANAILALRCALLSNRYDTFAANSNSPLEAAA